MKLITILSLLLISHFSFGQVKRHLDDIDAQIEHGRFSPFTMNKSTMKREIDSLGKLYNVEAIGYSKSIVGNRESMILFYKGRKEELKQCLIYTRWINF
jgi:hypothetical protein